MDRRREIRARTGGEAIVNDKRAADLILGESQQEKVHFFVIFSALNFVAGGGNWKSKRFFEKR